MKTKQQINNKTIKKACHSYYGSFYHINLCPNSSHFSLSITTLVLSIKSNKLRDERKEDFYSCFSVSCYIKGGRTSIFRHNRIFRHTYMYKKPTWTNQWNCNIFVQILCSYLRYTTRLLDLFFLLLAVILSQLHEKPQRKDWVTEKIYRRI